MYPKVQVTLGDAGWRFVETWNKLTSCQEDENQQQTEGESSIHPMLGPVIPYVHLRSNLIRSHNEKQIQILHDRLSQAESGWVTQIKIY